MTDLTLFYGTMESGKTTKLLQDNYNYRKHGHKVLIIKPLIDLKGGNTVVNRTNEFAPVDILLANDESIFDDKYLPLIKGTEVILVDEAQFLTEKQIIEFWMLAHKIGITVICYALKSDFKGRLFKGTQALIGFADRKNELTVNCKCGETAVFNARMVNGSFVFDGDEVAIDGLDNVSYVPLCSSCYFNEVISSETKEKVITYKKVLKRYKKDDESR